MTKSITIPKELPRDSALSYDFLRKEGIKLIQQMAGNTWTDHNTHDPGITILEQLCYAITDLAYRIDYEIEDLLGTDEGSSYGDLFGPSTILTVIPVTLLDIRKMVIDLEGVKNAWVETVSPTPAEGTADAENGVTKPKGLYRILVEKDELTQVGPGLADNIRARLNAHRNICEDVEEVRLLDLQLIRLQGTVEISDTVDDVNQLVADVLLRIASHLSPSISFYTLQQLLEKGKRTDEIFDGPLLTHGFIDNDELLRHTRKQEVHTSDVIREIMDVEGVLAVDELAIASGTNTVKSWLLPLDPVKTPKLDVRNMKETLKDLEFTSQGLEASIDPAKVEALYKKKTGALITRRELDLEERDILLPETQDRKLSGYYSIQNQFPANYGIGISGLPDSVRGKRKAQAKQLKAYLTLFEQLLANYFSQVGHFHKLVSFDGEDTRTYVYQSLLDTISGLEEVLKSKEKYLEYLWERSSGADVGLKRKNKFLNHLLARFGEQFTGYGLFQDTSKSNDQAAKKLITDKSGFLRDYPALSGGRAKGYDYSQAYWQNHNISGLEKRIARKLGIEDYTRRNLGDGDTEGFHMIEHILLRPHVKDVYPFQAHYAPGEITAFEASETTGFTRCVSPAHTLAEGEQIQIQGVENPKGVTVPSVYEGMHLVHTVGKDHFEIEMAFREAVTGATWRRTQPDVWYFIFSEPIIAFAPSSGPGSTFCEIATHNLKDGDRIEIAGTQYYDGVFEVTGVSENGFVIQVTFQKEETTGRWMPAGLPGDPYSFQLTFVLPEWMERYQNDQLKSFVENTIREETPAHLAVYIQWLSKPGMQFFDQAFHRFLSVIHKR